MLKEETLVRRLAKEYRVPDECQVPVGQPPQFATLASTLGERTVDITYNAQTCFEFHQLLVATLLGYGKSLEAFATAMTTADKSAIQNREKLARQFLQFSRLLWRIAYSRILTQHLAMLEAASVLRLPSDRARKHYQSYAGFASSLLPLEGDMVRKGFPVDEDEMGDELRRVRMDSANYLNESVGRADAFLKWLRLLVTHWGALDTISVFSNSTKGNFQNIDISLVSVRSPTSGGPINDRWKDTIRALASRTSTEVSDHAESFDANDAIGTLESLLESADPTFDQSNNFQAFNPEENSENSFQARTKIVKFGMHCEATLATLMTSGNGLDDGVCQIEVCNPICIGHNVIQCGCLCRNRTQH
jgi:hypothetical protein